jgi:hypothetical protein
MPQFKSPFIIFGNVNAKNILWSVAFTDECGNSGYEVFAGFDSILSNTGARKYLCLH